MDFGIAGRKAIICASSKGLGKACAIELANEGVDVIINGRNNETLEETAQEIRNATGVDVTAVACDVTSEEGRAKLLTACANPDILVNNAGGPPPGNFRDWDGDEWHKALEANMVTPILLTKAVIDGMIERKFGRVVNITSGAVKAPISILGLSNGARSGLTGFVAGLAREVAANNVTVNNLLPGPFETDRLTATLQGAAKKNGTTLEEEWAKRQSSNPSKRFGKPDEFGAACAFLCSNRAGFITGQNWLLDGGSYPGTF
ncbi:3-oxoacyl-ACP reductase [Kiloniella litopenaei]|uniref:3-oxoacyl-ACP reductase n=1 Tax=Kiloniella litopenaei TaxID=1549748 RepID=A0A0M2R455_9PROT|nr:SDR family oxidoreductase [Kiloniella litopenaei]KKJ76451.1 3-oxoacyl-ACP reductase [Kiloniella litopenaei]